MRNRPIATCQIQPQEFMKTYQNIETGELYAFDDWIDSFKLNNRNIRGTLSETAIPRPSEFHVWFTGSWIKDTDSPKGYKTPTSSVISYNPAWWHSKPLYDCPS